MKKYSARKIIRKAMKILKLREKIDSILLRVLGLDKTDLKCYTFINKRFTKRE